MTNLDSIFESRDITLPTKVCLLKGMTEAEMVGGHHRFNGHEFEQVQGVGGGQGSLACCSPWGYRKLDMTEHLN